MRSRFWSDEAKAILRQHYPTMRRSKLMALLPGRSWDAIKMMGQSMGLRRPSRYDAHYFWTEKNSSNLKKLKRMYEYAAWDDICAAFPEFTKTALQKEAYKRGFWRCKMSVRIMSSKRPDPLTRALTMRRIALGLTQQEVAAKLGIVHSTMRDAEKGTGNFGYKRLKRWCKLLGVQMSIVPVVSPLMQQAAADMQRWKADAEKREGMAA